MLVNIAMMIKNPSIYKNGQKKKFELEGVEG
jgi:hypothetical protein